MLGLGRSPARGVGMFEGGASKSKSKSSLSGKTSGTDWAGIAKAAAPAIGSLGSTIVGLFTKPAEEKRKEEEAARIRQAEVEKAEREARLRREDREHEAMLRKQEAEENRRIAREERLADEARLRGAVSQSGASTSQYHQSASEFVNRLQHQYPAAFKDNPGLARTLTNQTIGAIIAGQDPSMSPTYAFDAMKELEADLARTAKRVDPQGLIAPAAPYIPAKSASSFLEKHQGKGPRGKTVFRGLCPSSSTSRAAGPGPRGAKTGSMPIFGGGIRSVHTP